MDFAPLTHWPGHQEIPYLIAGPCSAESPEQLFEVAAQIKSLPYHIPVLRAGLWKPRTRPSSFEGVGARGLPWLREVKERWGFFTACEVARGEHVEKALAGGVDILWIGARTTANPFSVQEVAQALRGVDIPVMVKNPTAPDLPLWVGAIERIYAAGVRKVAALHRGFSSEVGSQYRNRPLWRIPIELKRPYPGLPLFCDPSHIAGKRELVFEVAQRALDSGADGLMIETHSHPQKALSDSRQQVTPESLGGLLGGLRRRSPSGDGGFESRLEELREKIDQIDLEILEALSQRAHVVCEIGKAKREANVRPFQMERMEGLMLERIKQAEKFRLSGEYVQELYQLIHSESIRLQS